MGFRPNWIGAVVCATTLFVLARAVPYAPDLAGDYCRKVSCCDGRQDQCSFPIKGTLCYCDEFCEVNRIDDCCPDYLPVCKGLPPPEPEPEPLLTCLFQGQHYFPGRKARVNCNDCDCQKISKNETKMLCENHVCLIDEKLTMTVNDLGTRYAWRASNYSEFWGRRLEEGIKLRLGTLQPQRFVRSMNPVRRIYDPNALPKELDSETVWPGYISRVQDQGWCGASWAISTAAIASDRYAIISKGKEIINLSAQHLLSCDNRGQQSCNGGYLDRAWMYIRKYGIVDEKCFPYEGKSTKCHIPRGGNLLTTRCPPAANKHRKDKYRVAPAYRLGNETDIMFEILKSGPVQATIKVYHDFFTYRSGIYKPTDLVMTDRTGYHSVRIVGWGEEYTSVGLQKYWKVANSWGTQWGENGYFRIVRGTNECEIESFVLATWPEVQVK